MGIAKLNLESDEVVIMQDAHVRDSASGSVTLVLTSQRLIQINRDFWGNDKSSAKFSFSEIKNSNGKPNVLVGKSADGASRLEVYFNSFEKYYTFQNRSAEKKWAAEIVKAYKIYTAEAKKKVQAKEDTASVLAPIKNAFTVVKQTLAIKAGTGKQKTIKCPRCGAEVTGETGTSVTCPYCETNLQIK